MAQVHAQPLRKHLSNIVMLRFWRLSSLVRLASTQVADRYGKWPAKCHKLKGVELAKDGVLIYLKKAVDYHRPNVRI